MAYKYRDSEEFRAKIFFYGGCVFCSPFCICIFRLLMKEIKYFPYNLFCDFLLFMLGILLVVKSYIIMLERDEKNVK